MSLFKGEDGPVFFRTLVLCLRTRPYVTKSKALMSEDTRPISLGQWLCCQLTTYLCQ